MFTAGRLCARQIKRVPVGRGCVRLSFFRLSLPDPSTGWTGLSVTTATTLFPKMLIYGRALPLLPLPLPLGEAGGEAKLVKAAAVGLFSPGPGSKRRRPSEGTSFGRPERNANKGDSPNLSSGPRDRAFLTVCSVCFSRT